MFGSSRSPAAHAARPRRHRGRPRPGGRAQCVDQRRRVDHAAPARVHEDRPALHRARRVASIRCRVSAVSGTWRLTKSEPARRSSELATLGAVSPGSCRARGEQQAHVEAAKQLRDAPGDPSEADEPDRRAGELAPEELLLAPATAPPRTSASASAIRRAGRQHERDRELRGCVRENVRRVGGSNPSLAGRVDVDVVEADGEVRDYLNESPAMRAARPRRECSDRRRSPRHRARALQPAAGRPVSGSRRRTAAAGGRRPLPAARNHDHSRSGSHPLSAHSTKRRRRPIRRSSSPSSSVRYA